MLHWEQEQAMSNAELLIEEIKGLPEDYAAQALDFVGYLKEKAAQERAAKDGLDAGEDCPLCAKYRDPATGDLRFNAETIAAFEEGDAMLRGEIPAKWYASLEEMWEDLEK
jgi:hypothetical protein